VFYDIPELIVETIPPYEVPRNLADTFHHHAVTSQYQPMFFARSTEKRVVVNIVRIRYVCSNEPEPRRETPKHHVGIRRWQLRLSVGHL